jgi:phosphonate transport system permease protein
VNEGVRGAFAASAATPSGRTLARRIAIAVALVAVLVQAAIVVNVRPQDLITGARGMADIVHRAFPPNIGLLGATLWPALQTVDIALFGTVAAAVVALPLSVLAARNTTFSPIAYGIARAVIAFTRVVPDLIWALIFVAAVGLGSFPGALALAVHSIGMLGRLFAETIEEMEMGPVEALTLTGASRAQVFSQAIVPGIAPSLLGIVLYRLDENVRSSLLLGFVGAGGIGFQIFTAMQLFQYRDVAFYLGVTFVLVIAVERLSAALRRALHVV